MLRGYLVCLFVSLCASNLAAQGTSVIFGTVSDQTGSAVARASVTANNEATGVTTKVMSNEAGYYLFPDLRQGSYKITCKVQGFQTVERTGVILEVDRRARVDLQMQVGEVKQVLEVQGTGTTVDTM